jgi:hypothetical protein
MKDKSGLIGVLKMVSLELISTLRELSRSDKFYIMQILISELAQQETDLIKPNQSYPVWSPYDAVEAADTMLKVLQAAKAQDHA